MYNTSNNSFGKFEASIGPSVTSFIMQSAYSGLFPSHNGTSDPDYFLKFEQKDALQVIVKREIVRVTAKSGSLFTIVRGAGLCPASDTATIQTNTSFSFDAGDSVSLTIVSEHIQQIENDLAGKAEDNEVVHLDGAETVAGVKTFSSSPIVPTPTTDFQPTTKKYVDDSIVSSSAPEALFEKDDYIAGETILANDSLFVESLPTFTESTVVQNIGDVTANTRVSILGIGSGVASNTLKLSLRKFVSPSANLSVRIETTEITPAVTAITGTYIASASSTYTGEYPRKAFDGAVGIPSNVRATNNSDTGRLKIQLPSAVKIYKYNVVPRETAGSVQYPKARTFEGSNDNSNWTVLDTQTNQTTWTQYVPVSYSCTSTTAYLYYRINISAPQSGTFVSIHELQLFRLTDDGVFCANNMLGMMTANTTVGVSSQDEQPAGFEPSGTLVDVNATATITAASLTTSLVDTTITLAGSITITKGQQVAIVLSQVGDVVNGTNYYGVGYVARDTRTRGFKIYNGSVRYTDRPDGVDSTQSFGFVLGASIVSGDKRGIKIVPTRNIYITQVNKISSATDTIAYIANSSLTTIAQSSFSGNIATFPKQLLLSGVVYYILTDQGGLSRTVRADNTTSFPLLLNGLDLVAGRDGSSDSLSFIYNIESVTIQNELDAYNSFPYTSSTLFENRVLSKTNATYSYKLPTDYVRIATQGYTVGQSVTSKYFGLHTYPGLVANTAYYVANTAGAISAVAGSNPYVLGKTDGNGTLKINGKVLNKSITVSASPFSYTNTTGGPIQVSITGGTVNPIVINGVTTATATNHINTLPSGATMTVTYTVLPTITYSDL